MIDDRYTAPIDPPSERPTAEELEEWAIEDADRELKETPYFSWEEES